MNQDVIPTVTDAPTASSAGIEERSAVNNPAEIQPPSGSYVKHAMRNMVRKRSKSLQHFFLSTVGLLGLFIALAYLTK
jgi:Protein of unknown function (DUF3285)